MKKTHIALVMMASLIFAGCGSTWDDAFNPTKKDLEKLEEAEKTRTETNRARQEEFKQATFKLYNMDLSDQESICKKAQESAELDDVTLDKCVLEGSEIKIAITAFEEKFDWTLNINTTREEFNVVAEKIINRKAESFYSFMIRAIDYSRKNTPT